MTSLGEVLRRERLRRNLEVGTIAGELKISARFLAAIEAEDFEQAAALRDEIKQAGERPSGPKNLTR